MTLRQNAEYCKASVAVHTGDVALHYHRPYQNKYYDLEIAYVAGGATAVEQRIDQMVTDGKITAEQAVQLKAASQKSYEELQKKLKELSVAEVQVEVPKTE